MQLLNSLLKKNPHNFKIKIVTYRDVENISKRAKAANYLGNDLISIKLIKKFHLILFHI